MQMLVSENESICVPAQYRNRESKACQVPASTNKPGGKKGRPKCVQPKLSHGFRTVKPEIHSLRKQIILIQIL